MFKNVMVYRVDAGWPSATDVLEKPWRAAFCALFGHIEDKAVGWVDRVAMPWPIGGGGRVASGLAPDGGGPVVPSSVVKAQAARAGGPDQSAIGSQARQKERRTLR